MNNICIVFVSNKSYFSKFISTSTQLIKNGNYKGDICLIISDDLVNNQLLDCDIIKNNNIIIKKFNNIEVPPIKRECAVKKNKVDGCAMKFHLFNTFFKKWKFIFYIDCGIKIMGDISPIINEAKENTLLAHSDSYPTYKWKLSRQFSQKYMEYFTLLNNNYDLNIDYFQSTVLLYDTNIIEENTFNEIIDLYHKYPIGIWNDQPYLSLYFIHIKPYWKQIPLKNNDTYFYDYLSRNKNNKYIMLKM